MSNRIIDYKAADDVIGAVVDVVAHVGDGLEFTQAGIYVIEIRTPETDSNKVNHDFKHSQSGL